MTLSNRSVFPNFFRVVPSDELLPPALATLMRYYGWKQLSILTEEEPQFLKVFIHDECLVSIYMHMNKQLLYMDCMQLLPLLNVSLSRASISVKDSVVFTAGSPTVPAATNILVSHIGYS